jgi:ATP-dependent RNA helicase DeaD
MNDLSFSSLPISQEILHALTDMGFEEATPIQAETIPHILENRDLIGQAQTGTGKTCAFGIPIIDAVDKNLPHIQTLILSPTRELAIQIAEELHEVCKYKEGIRIVPIFGGQPIDRQILALKRKPQIIVGTPGRVMDHMRRKTIKLDHLEKLVLDEADEMLNMGFVEDIDTILLSTPEGVQRVLFSATMPKAIIRLTETYLKDPIHIRIAAKELTIPLVEQFHIEVREENKLEILSRLVDAGNISRALVFCNTKKRVDELADKLNTRGYSVEALHGDMKQASRDRVMKQFRSGKLDLLIATDVAARGIDVDDIEVVFNFDLPSDDEYYIHRIGRTGRAGKTGKAYTFVVGREIIDLKNIQHAVKATIKRAAIPTISGVREGRISAILETLSKSIGQEDLSIFSEYIEQYTDSLNVSSEGESFVTTLDVAAALLKRICGESVSDRPEITEVIPYEEYAKRTRNREANGEPRPMPTRNHGKAEEAGMQRLFLSVGIKDNVRPNQIVQFIASKGDIPGKAIGAIAIFEDFTFVDVPTELAEQVIKNANHGKLGRKVVSVEKKKTSDNEEALRRTSAVASKEKNPSKGPARERRSASSSEFKDKKSSFTTRSGEKKSKNYTSKDEERRPKREKRIITGDPKRKEDKKKKFIHE